MVKETEKFVQERRVRSTHVAYLWSVPEGDIGCLFALAGRYVGINPQQVSAISRMRLPWNRRAGLLTSSCRRLIHSRKHTVELVKYSGKRVR